MMFFTRERNILLVLYFFICVSFEQSVSSTLSVRTVLYIYVRFVEMVARSRSSIYVLSMYVRMYIYVHVVDVCVFCNVTNYCVAESNDTTLGARRMCEKFLVCRVWCEHYSLYAITKQEAFLRAVISLSLSLSVCLARCLPLPWSFYPYLSKLTSPSTALRLFLSSVRFFVCSLFLLLSLLSLLCSLSPLKRLSSFSRIRALPPSFSFSLFYSLFPVGSAWSHF